MEEQDKIDNGPGLDCVRNGVSLKKIQSILSGNHKAPDVKHLVKNVTQQILELSDLTDAEFIKEFMVCLSQKLMKYEYLVGVERNFWGLEHFLRIFSKIGPKLFPASSPHPKITRTRLQQQSNHS